MALLPPSPIGQPPGNSFWNDWYEKLRTIVNTGAISIAFANITGKPTTLAGYGITNGQTALNNSAGLAAAVSDETGTGFVVFNNNPTLVGALLNSPIVRGGTGAPFGGSNGDFYFRGDTPGVANQRIYVKSGGAWVGIV